MFFLGTLSAIVKNEFDTTILSSIHQSKWCCCIKTDFTRITPNKMLGPTFQNLVFYLFEESSLPRWQFQISVEAVKPFGCTKQFCIMQLSIPYCVRLIMVTITRHVFIYILQMEHFLSCEIWHGQWKKIWPPLWNQKLQMFEKVEQTGMGSFKGVLHPWALFLKIMCIFSKNESTLNNVYPMDLIRNVPRNSKITVSLQLKPLLWSYSKKVWKSIFSMFWLKNQ